MTELFRDQMIGAPDHRRNLHKPQKAGADVKAKVGKVFHDVFSVAAVNVGAMMLSCKAAKGK